MELNGKTNIDITLENGVEILQGSCVEKQKRIVLNIILNNTLSFSAQTRKKIGTIPATKAPSSGFLVPIIFYCSSVIAKTLCGTLQIDSAGSIYIFCNTAMTTEYHASISASWDID